MDYEALFHYINHIATMEIHKMAFNLSIYSYQIYIDIMNKKWLDSQGMFANFSYLILTMTQVLDLDAH